MNAITPPADDFACTTMASRGSNVAQPIVSSGESPEIGCGVPETAPKSSWGGRRAGAGRPRNDKPLHRSVGPRFYAVQVAGGTEVRVSCDLAFGETRPGWIKRPGYECYLPQRKLARMRRGKQTVVVLPMIQGYVFVRFDVREDDWRPILSCPDVKRIISSRENAPSAIPDADVEHMRRLSEEALGIDPLRMPVREAGDALRVVDGPFAGFPALCAECDGRSTSATVQVFGRMCTVTLPWAAFEVRN